MMDGHQGEQVKILIYMGVRVQRETRHRGGGGEGRHVGSEGLCVKRIKRPFKCGEGEGVAHGSRGGGEGGRGGKGGV
jgi:hypothetical protein